jgi:hypothetical protein
MLLNIIAASLLLLPLAAALSLAGGYFMGNLPFANYVAGAGIVFAVCNMLAQLFIMRWLMLDILSPILGLFGLELYVEKEVIEEEDDKATLIFGAAWLFITHILIITFLFLLQVPIIGFFAGFCYAVFLLGDWVMHDTETK